MESSILIFFYFNESCNNEITCFDMYSFVFLAALIIFKIFAPNFLSVFKNWYELTGKQGPPTPGPGKCI